MCVHRARLEVAVKNQTQRGEQLFGPRNGAFKINVAIGLYRLGCSLQCGLAQHAIKRMYTPGDTKF